MTDRVCDQMNNSDYTCTICNQTCRESLIRKVENKLQVVHEDVKSEESIILNLQSDKNDKIQNIQSQKGESQLAMDEKMLKSKVTYQQYYGEIITGTFLIAK